MPHFFICEDRLRRRLEARQTGIGDNRLDAGQIGGNEDVFLESSGLADIQDFRVRQRAAHEGQFAHAGQLDVADEFALAAQIAVIFLAMNRAADAVSSPAGFHHAALPVRLSADLAEAREIERGAGQFTLGIGKLFENVEVIGTRRPAATRPAHARPRAWHAGCASR